MEKQTPERWRRVKKALDAAFEAPAAERTTLLERLLGNDPTLCAEAEDYLELAGDLGSFIEKPAASLSPRHGRDPMAGRRIGPYKLEQLLGRGGMGSVYLAAREDDYEQRVALKLIHRALSTSEMVERFRKERQILAHLEHPNIARLLDGGTTDEGLPYFVMEFVEGLAIDRYCDEHELSVGERLELLCQVAAAVHFAHRNLVVHRDLKPGNILVGADGVPKLLDFGIAKLLGSESITRLLDHAVGPMTFEYASPEQILGEPITTASDVYALGVLAYELTAGHLPYRREQYRHPLSVVQAISSQDPPKPSTAIWREERSGAREPAAGAGANSSGAQPSGARFSGVKSVAATRKSDPARLARRLAGDVDAIVLKALRREPERRYGSAEQLAEDIRRHLDGRPVEARAGSLAYRAVKFVRRNRLAIATMAAVLTLIVGFVATLSEQLDRTRRERNRATMAMDLLVELLESPELRDAGAIGVDDVIQRGVDLFDRGFADDLEAQANTLNSLAMLYTYRGAYDKAEELYEGALERRRRMWGEDHPLVAESLHNLAHLLAAKREYERAEGLSRRALAIQRGHYRKPHRLLAKGITSLAIHLSELERLEEAEPLYREALRMKIGLYGEVHLEVATGHANLGTLFYDTGDYGAARIHYEKALEIRQQLLPPNHQKVGKSLSHMGRVLIAGEAYEEAVEIFREVLAMRTANHGPAHPEVAYAQNTLAFALERTGRLEEAEALYRKALAIRVESFGPDQASAAVVKKNLASLLVLRGNFAMAEALAREAHSVFEREGTWRIADTLSVLGAALAGQGRDGEAEKMLIESFTSLRREKGDEFLYTRDAGRRLREFLSRRGKLESMPLTTLPR